MNLKSLIPSLGFIAKVAVAMLLVNTVTKRAPNLPLVGKIGTGL